MDSTIRKAGMQELDILTALACLLWPDHRAAELKDDLADIMAQEDAAFFLAYAGEKAIGFAQCQLRHDYVEGAAHSPVGYLEGIYVAEGFRKMGVAKALLSACERWAKAKGCREFASDCELHNAQSLKFHIAMGFEEANRIICFTKKLQ